MSDNIPFEIQEEIIKRLPAKSLIQFRSVSKSWKSLIDSADFIKHYSSQQQHLLVRYDHAEPEDIIKPSYVSIVDDDTFPGHKVSHAVPLQVNMLENSGTIGCSHGLLCLSGYYGRDKIVVLWNVSVRKVVAAVVPNVGRGIYETNLGFGVCRETSDPKILKITDINSWIDTESISYIPWQVEVFTLSTGAWRSPYTTNLPRTSIHFSRFKVVIEGCLYWLAANRVAGFGFYSLIISFDMTSEEFREINLPDSLAHRPYRELSMSKLRESLAVLECGLEANDKVINVWMEDGVSKSFTKLFTVKKGDNLTFIRGFRNTGEPIIQVGEDHQELVVYEPCSKRINNLGVSGIDVAFSVYSYMESLLLFDKPDFSLYDEEGF